MYCDDAIDFNFMVENWRFPIDLAGIISAKNASRSLSEEELGDISEIRNAWRCGDIDRMENRIHRMLCQHIINPMDARKAEEAKRSRCPDCKDAGDRITKLEAELLAAREQVRTLTAQNRNLRRKNASSKADRP